MAINLFTQMAELFKQPQLMYGQVASSGSGLVTVTLPSGGTVTARGDATPGDYVYVRNGVVEGEAPALTTFSIDI